MMTANTKDELLAITEKEYNALMVLIDKVEPDKALIKIDDVSIKDVIGHRAYWITLFMGWYQDGQAGRDVSLPAKGYKWNQLNALNAKLREAQSALGWDDVQILLKDAYRDLRSLMDNLSNEDLYGTPMKGGKNNWTTGRWAEAAGPSHFRSARKFIRKAMKSI